MPIGLCDRLHVVDTEGSMSYFSVDPYIHQETGEEQSGWRSLGAQRNGGSHVIVEGGL